MTRQLSIISFIFCLFWANNSFAKNDATTRNLITFETLPLEKKLKEKVFNGTHIVKSEVETSKDGLTQTFDFSISGRHKRSCRFAIRKLKQYEKFKDYIGIVKKSDYDEKTKELYILMDPPILSGDLILNFKIERIKKSGVFPFKFEKGFLTGLTGEIHVSEHRRKCLFHIESRWKGNKTKYHDRIISTFALVASKLAMDRLFKVSSTY